MIKGAVEAVAPCHSLPIRDFWEFILQAALVDADPKSGVDRVFLVLAISVLTADPSPVRASAPVPATGFGSGESEFARRVLDTHNRYRGRYGAAPLIWSASLAASAKTYGPALAKGGTLIHSPRAGRPGQAENLWKGTHGRYAIDQMIEYWADERWSFRPGIFPNVSTTDNWIDVSHFVQMIWAGTTHVGCHVEATPTHDFLICRYSPKGNRDGRAVGLEAKPTYFPTIGEHRPSARPDTSPHEKSPG